MPEIETWKTISNAILAIGIGLSAVGTFGAFYFQQQLDKHREDKESEQSRIESERQEHLSTQVNRLVDGNEELKERLKPFELLAKERYPESDSTEALEKLRLDLTSVAEKAAALEQKVKEANPVLQPLLTAVSSVDVIIQSDEQINTTFMDRGGYLAVGKGKQAILTTAASQSLGIQNGKGQVVYRGTFNMNVSDVGATKSILSLREADYLQIMFDQMPKESNVVGGHVTLTLNNSVRLDFDVPPQKTGNGMVFIRDLLKLAEILKAE